jgi:hypothetical protein
MDSEQGDGSAVVHTGSPPATSSTNDVLKEVLPDNALWADKEVPTPDVVNGPPPAAKAPEPAPASTPDAAPEGHQVDKGLQKIQQDFATMRTENDELKAMLTDALGKLQTPAPANGDGQPQPPPEPDADPFAEIDMFDPAQLKTAIGQAVAAKGPDATSADLEATLDAINKRLDTIDQKVGKRDADDYWSNWQTEKGLTEADQKELETSAAKYVDEKFAYDPAMQKAERAAAINVAFEQLTDQRVASKSPASTPSAPAVPPTEGPEIVTPGASARTGPVQGPDDFPTVPDDALYRAD